MAKTLREKIEKTSASLKKTVAKIDPASNFALIVIDAQDIFCSAKNRRGSKRMENMCRKIGRAARDFRKACVKVYAVATVKDIKKPEKLGFCHWLPQKKDTILLKETWSAFDSGETRTILKSDKKKTLLIAGFNTSACVMKSAIDAVFAGHDVYLLKDLTADEKGSYAYNYGLNMMKQYDVKLITSKQALKMLGVKA